MTFPAHAGDHGDNAVTYTTHRDAITILMTMVMRDRDLSAFHIVTKGLDGKTKALRLRQLCNAKKRKIGPNLLAHLKYFQKTIFGFRDRIAHTAMSRGETEEKFYFSPIDRMPWRELGIEFADAQPADAIEHIKIFEYGKWLSDFTYDLTTLTRRS